MKSAQKEQNITITDLEYHRHLSSYRTVFTVLTFLFYVTISCKEGASTVEPAPVIYSLTTTVEPENSGTITPSSGNFEQGTPLSLTVQPSEGFEFREWHGDASGQNNPLQFTIQKNTELIALFRPVYDLPGYEESALPKFKITILDQFIQDDPKVMVDLVVEEEGVVSYSGKIGIEFRGSTSQGFPKKSYGFETWDQAGNDIEVSLLGYPEEEDWILYGPFADKTFIRNYWVYTVSNHIGLYASRTRFVEVEIDEEYQGVYVFMEKIKRDKNRVDIKKLEPSDTSEEDITGGYILKIDKTTGDGNGSEDYAANISFRSQYGVNGELLDFPAHGPKQGSETYFIYEYPDYDEITEQQKEYIIGYIHEFETALLTDDFEMSFEERTYTDYMDLDSFVDFFIINELAHNADAYRLSTFLSKDRGGKIKMGPVWDFNLSMGNDFSPGFRSSPETWIWQYNQNIPGDMWLVPFWWERLMEDPWFRYRIKQRWTELRASELSDEYLLGLFDDTIAMLEEDQAVTRNYNRWPMINEIVFGNYQVFGSYEGEVAFLRDWLETRIDWMDQEISSWEDPVQ